MARPPKKHAQPTPSQSTARWTRPASSSGKPPTDGGYTTFQYRTKGTTDYWQPHYDFRWDDGRTTLATGMQCVPLNLSAGEYEYRIVHRDANGYMTQSSTGSFTQSGVAQVQESYTNNPDGSALTLPHLDGVIQANALIDGRLWRTLQWAAPANSQVRVQASSPGYGTWEAAIFTPGMPDHGVLLNSGMTHCIVLRSEAGDTTYDILQESADAKPTSGNTLDSVRRAVLNVHVADGILLHQTVLNETSVTGVSGLVANRLIIDGNLHQVLQFNTPPDPGTVLQTDIRWRLASSNASWGDPATVYNATNQSGVPAGVSAFAVDIRGNGIYEFKIALTWVDAFDPRRVMRTQSAYGTVGIGTSAMVSGTSQEGAGPATNGSNAQGAQTQAQRPQIHQQVDRWGNVLAVNDARTLWSRMPTWHTERTYDVANQLVSESTWDDFAQTQVTQRTNYHDALGRLVATDGARTDVRDVNLYQYDAAGKRHADGGRIVHQHDAFGQETRTLTRSPAIRWSST